MPMLLLLLVFGLVSQIHNVNGSILVFQSFLTFPKLPHINANHPWLLYFIEKTTKLQTLPCY